MARAVTEIAMAISPQAGQAAPKGLLIDMDRLRRE